MREIFDLTKKRLRAAYYEPDGKERDILRGYGLVRVPLEIPFRVSPVNVVLALGERPTLIDAGIRYANNMERLEQALEQVGLKVEELQEIWLTHPHLDHFGLAGEIVKRSGATLVTWEHSTTRFESYRELWDKEQISFLEMLSLSGVKEEIRNKVRNTSNFFDEMASHVNVTRTFAVGESMELAGRHQVTPLHVPGHSPWCTAFWMHDAGVLLGGDVLLERITSNPILYPPDAAPAQWQGLDVYDASLSRLHTLPCQHIVPGHGFTFGAHQDVIERAQKHLAERQERVFQILDDGPKTAYEVACALFGESVAHNAMFLVMGEAVRHLDWLVAKQLARFDIYTRQYQQIG